MKDYNVFAEALKILHESDESSQKRGGDTVYVRVISAFENWIYKNPTEARCPSCNKGLMTDKVDISIFDQNTSEYLVSTICSCGYTIRAKITVLMK